MIPRRKFAKQFIGQKYNALSIKKYIGVRKGSSTVLAQCDCGEFIKTALTSIRHGATKSCGCLRRCSPGERAHKDMYSNYRRSARDRNILFKLTLEQFKQISAGSCSYCGTLPKLWNPYLKSPGVPSGRGLCAINRHKIPKLQKKRILKNFEEQWIRTNGIDRVDNTQGYNLQNAVPCCKKCNRAKMDNSVSDFLKWVNTIYHFQKEQNAIT